MLRYLSDFARYLVTSQVWDTISLLVIIVNSFLILVSDPNDDKSPNAVSDMYFLFVYTFEMLVKILAFGLIVSDDAYLRDTWNILDFLIINIGLITLGIEIEDKKAGKAPSGDSGGGISALRAFRILRPLRTVKKIPGLKSIMGTLYESMPALLDTVIVVMFVLIIFAIAGVQVGIIF